MLVGRRSYNHTFECIAISTVQIQKFKKIISHVNVTKCLPTQFYFHPDMFIENNKWTETSPQSPDYLNTQQARMHCVLNLYNGINLFVKKEQSHISDIQPHGLLGGEHSMLSLFETYILRFYFQSWVFSI